MFSITQLSIDLSSEEQRIEKSKIIVSHLHAINYAVLTSKDTIAEKDYIYLWDNIFQIIIESQLKSLLDIDLRVTFHEVFTNSIQKYPRLLLSDKIVSHVLSLELDIDFQKYLSHYFERTEFSITEELIAKDLDVVSDLYLIDKINESIYGIIFSRIPSLKSYSSSLCSKLEDCFYTCKAIRLQKRKQVFLKEFLNQKNMAIRNFYFRGSLYPSICIPNTGRFKRFLDGSSDKPTKMFSDTNLIPKNFNRVVKNEFNFFFNLNHDRDLLISNNSVWRDQMKFIADYFEFVSQQDIKEKMVPEVVFVGETNSDKENMSLTPKSKKRGRSKYDPKKELGFHKNSNFQPKSGKRVRI